MCDVLNANGFISEKSLSTGQNVDIIFTYSASGSREDNNDDDDDDDNGLHGA